VHTLMSHACAFQTQLAAATRLAHVPRALSESLDTPTCLSKKLASAQRPAPRGPTAGTPSGRPRHAGGAHLAPRRAATPGAGATLWRPAGRASAQSPLPRPSAGTPSGHHRHAGSPAHAPRMPGVSGRVRAAPAARGAGAELRPASPWLALLAFLLLGCLPAPCSGLKSSGVGALCPDRARGRGAHRAGPWSAARAGAPAQRASVASKGRGAGAGAKGVRRL
jgi:hypothetical protein